MSAAEMPKAYDPRQAESRWYAFWEQGGFFVASADRADRRLPFTLQIPPPNVTGTLHIGHACRTTFEDVLVRHKRMQGRNALWVPGTDHAGIATQVVVERQLKREGLTRHDLGRDKFVERVWTWKEESGGTILRQLRRLGASCDWTREYFTMEPRLSRAVREAFVRLWEEGLIYRATRLINWCVSCRTGLSDLETENVEGHEGELFDFAYPLAEGGGEIVVSTTRPETMLGDTAVAVHPDDPRYRALHGKNVRHPILDREIPIITDAELVDPKFGSGAVKVTPAHDPNDFATGKRHQLPEINILNLDGTLNGNAGPFSGLDRFAGRKAVKKKLEELGLVRGTKKHAMTLPRCQRCDTIVEPIISTQWWVKMQPLAEPAIAAVEDGRIQIIPDEWAKTYFHWMRNIQDWNVSRQLWWGHPIPAWYCPDGHITVARETATRCAECGATELRPDADVLDTWFSSSLLPFTSLGWPDETPELRRFYPSDDMETGYDILFFWVARMAMMGLHFMKDVPFRRVLLAGLITDERGDKMSKVKGNVIDPLDVIDGTDLAGLLEKAEKGGAKESGLRYLKETYPEGIPAYGTDALRMTLLSYSPQARRIALSVKRIEGYRNFANKLWNASRFSLMNLDGTGTRATGKTPAPRELANRYILAELGRAIEAATAGIDAYRFDEGSGALYHFVWDELCDWYVELSKPLLASEDPAVVAETRQTLVHVLETTLRALHPMMPYITEEIWQQIDKEGAAPSLAVARYPTAAADARADDAAIAEMAMVKELVVSVRTIRAEHDLPRSRPLEVLFHAEQPERGALLERERGLVERLIGGALRRVDPAELEQRTTGTAAVFVNPGLRAVVPDVIDVAKERDRLGRELKKIEKDLAAAEKKLGNEGFLSRAPAEVVAQERARHAELADRLTQMKAALDRLA